MMEYFKNLADDINYQGLENIEDQEISGRIMQQGPEVDGISTILDSRLKIGEIVKAVVTGSSGPDLEVSRK